MQVPTLVVRGNERMLDVSEVKPPGAMNGFAIFFLLSPREPLAFIRAMRRRGENVRCAIGEPYARARKRDLHHVFGEVAGGVVHHLIGRGDAAAGRVIVSAKMRGDAAAA